MSSSTQNPFLDTLTSHRISAVSADSDDARLRPSSGLPDPDVISPVQSQKLATRGPGNGLLMKDGPIQESRHSTTQYRRPARPVKATVLLTLRYRRRSICLLACYLPFLVVPWVLTCILAIRPPNLPSYYNQMGQYGSNLWLIIVFWMELIRILNSIASLITVPILSALLAQGAVVYTQRRKLKQALSLRQTFALADRGWSDLPILWNAILGKESAGTSSKYLWLAAGLLALSAIQVPVQQALVTVETITIMTCNDNPIYDFTEYCDPDRVPTIVAYDPEPFDLAATPQNVVVQEVIKNLAIVSDQDVQLQMWHEPSTSVSNPDDDLKPNSNTFSWYFPPSPQLGFGHATFFVSAVPNATTTGVLREHAMRLNSSVKYSIIDSADFPMTCGGSHPFVTSYSNPSDLVIEICVPGDYTSSPWTLSRDRQDIDEELFIKVHIPGQSHILREEFTFSVLNFTIHCKASTTRGYFELGNYRNNFTAGPLMEKWPDSQTMWEQYNDYLGLNGAHLVPSVVNNYNNTVTFPIGWGLGVDPFGTYALPTPGPLMTAAMAMWGNQSFFYVATNSSNSTFPSAVAQICQAGNIPFSRFTNNPDVNYDLDACYEINSQYTEEYDDNNETLETLLYQWFQFLSKSNNFFHGAELLSTAIFFASQAWLTQTADPTWAQSARSIYTSPGSPVFRPAKTLAGTIIISSFIFLQVVGLSILTWYIYTVPNWTTALDSLAVARLAKSVGDDELPLIGPVSDEDFQKLRKVDGLVGVVDDEYGAATVVDTLPAEGLPAARPKSADGLVDVTSARSESGDAALPLAPAAATGSPFKLARGAPGLISKRHAPPKKKKDKRKKKEDRDGNVQEKEGLRTEEV